MYDDLVFKNDNFGFVSIAGFVYIYLFFISSSIYYFLSSYVTVISLYDFDGLIALFILLGLFAYYFVFPNTLLLLSFSKSLVELLKFVKTVADGEFYKTGLIFFIGDFSCINFFD